MAEPHTPLFKARRQSARDQLQETTAPAQFVPGMRCSDFDFAAQRKRRCTLRRWNGSSKGYGCEFGGKLGAKLAVVGNSARVGCAKAVCSRD
eukprot:2300368-Rhodomonas_salina.1